MIEENKELIRRYQDAYNTLKLDALDEILHPDWVSNGWPEGVPKSIETAKHAYRQALEVFPDAQWIEQDLIAEADKVVLRYVLRATHQGEILGLPPTGKVIEGGGISIFRIADGRIVEHWAYADEVGFLHRLGADVPPEWLALGHR